MLKHQTTERVVTKRDQRILVKTPDYRTSGNKERLREYFLKHQTEQVVKVSDWISIGNDAITGK